MTHTWFFSARLPVKYTALKTNSAVHCFFIAPVLSGSVCCMNKYSLCQNSLCCSQWCGGCYPSCGCFRSVDEIARERENPVTVCRCPQCDCLLCTNVPLWLPSLYRCPQCDCLLCTDVPSVTAFSEQMSSVWLPSLYRCSQCDCLLCTDVPSVTAFSEQMSSVWLPSLYRCSQCDCLLCESVQMFPVWLPSLWVCTDVPIVTAFSVSLYRCSQCDCLLCECTNVPSVTAFSVQMSSVWLPSLCRAPWFNCNVWLGIKHNVTYSL